MLKDAIKIISTTPEKIRREFAEMSLLEMKTRPAPGTWSAQEIIGHLDDLEDVLAGDVADLVCQHARQFRLVLAERQRAPGNEDVAAGSGKGVDVVRIEHGEVIGDVLPFGLRGDRGADHVHVAGQRGVLVKVEKRNGFGRNFPAHVALFLDRHRRHRLLNCLGLFGRLFEDISELRPGVASRHKEREDSQYLHSPQAGT